MSVTAILHGYPPDWSMGGEVSTHRTLTSLSGSHVFAQSAKERYVLDGVNVHPASGQSVEDVIADLESVNTDVVFAHSSLSDVTTRAAMRVKKPSILAVHAPIRFASDLRRAWSRATVRLYNTEAARRDWKDPSGWLLHPPIDEPTTMFSGPHDALTLTSSLLNKGVVEVLELAKKWPHRRFIIVESPAHATHGDPTFWDQADILPNVEVWPRLRPEDVGLLWVQTHILLVPSRYETYGMSALEAAWYGIPSVHVDTPHVHEGIGSAARLLESHTVDELWSAIAEIESDYTRWSDRSLARTNELYWRGVRELQDFAEGVAKLAPR